MRIKFVFCCCTSFNWIPSVEKTERAICIHSVVCWRWRITWRWHGKSCSAGRSFVLCQPNYVFRTRRQVTLRCVSICCWFLCGFVESAHDDLYLHVLIIRVKAFEKKNISYVTKKINALLMAVYGRINRLKRFFPFHIFAIYLFCLLRFCPDTGLLVWKCAQLNVLEAFVLIQFEC